MEILDADLKYIVDHVFSPPKLPQERDPDSHRKDSLLLAYVANTAEAFAKILQNSADEGHPDVIKVWNIIKKMLETMGSLYVDGGIIRNKLGAALQQMEVDDVIPVLIEEQNAGIIFRKPATDILTFEAFEVSLPSDVVVQTTGKIAMRFPTNPRLPFPADDTILSTLAKVISHLSVTRMEEAAPLSKKGGEYHHEVRNTASPRFITEAIAGIIRATPPSRTILVDTTYVEKRLDDHVLWKSAFMPWRRSPMWLLIRVAMQTTLKQWEAGIAQDYKAFQAFLMASLLYRATSGDPNIFTCDLLKSMMLKVVKRLSKIGDLVRDFTFPTLKTAADAVLHTSGTLEQRWEEVRKRHERTVQWKPPSQKALRSKTLLDFSFPHSQDFLLELIERHRSPTQRTIDFNQGSFEATLRRELSTVPMLDSSHIPTISGDNIESSLITFELWVETYLEQWEKSPLRTDVDCLVLSSRIEAYRKKAVTHYEGAPERVSLMHLCILELWTALDKICTKWCPLLLEYSPEIAQNITDPLILPYFGQMGRLERVQAYLDHRHKLAQGNGGRSVFRQVNAQTSFHNQFFKLPTAAPLLALESKIREDGRRQKAATMSQLREYNEKYGTLMQQAQALSCLCVEADSPGGRILQHKKNKCPKCQLQKAAKALRITPFEEFLPENILAARPIVFELRCPMPFAVWRDATTMVILSILGPQLEPQPESYPLHNYTPLKNYFVDSYDGCRIRFASSTKSLKQSHYGNPCSLPATENDVLFKHKGTFNIFDASAAEPTDTTSGRTLRSSCAFPVGGLYAPLQAFVDDTRHAPNAVIAAVSKAPLGLSLTEFTAFGQLRAGNRIQWRNIMRAIKSQTLSFSDPAIFSLIAQSIWQAGPTGDVPSANDPYREAHLDLLDESFGSQVAEELLRTTKFLGDNWKQVNFLAIVVILALRVHAFTPHSSVRSHIQRLLCTVRDLCMRWLKLLSNPQLLVIEQDQQQLEDHRAQALANAAVVLKASFDVERNGYSEVFLSSKDAVMYIYATILISAVHTRTFTSGLQLLACRNRRISLKIEEYLIRACLQDPSILKKVVGLAWPQQVTGNRWTAVSSCENHWWRSSRSDSSRSQTFHINIIDGSFLINGKAFDRLPPEYGNNPIYIALFKDHVFRAVLQSDIKDMQYQTHYGMYEVHFGLVGERLTILRSDDTDIEEYVPTESIQEDLPSILCSGHCFWYSRKAHTISVLPLSQIWDAAVGQHWTIDLHMYSVHKPFGRVTKRTMATNNVKNLIDPHSKISRALAKTLAPLEPSSRGLVVTSHEDNSKFFIHLPRHDLRFTLQGNELQCLSIPGYLVDRDLSGIGCLVGLKSILNLRPADLRQPGRKVIVPKGSMVLAPAKYGHVDISVDVECSTGYFVYDVDDLLGRLVGTRTMESDLYLIKLHAFTASSQPDPLTQRTGTDEALDRLEGAASFSFHSISKESRSYLDDIATLTPLRTFYPAHLQVMETITWTEYLPVCAQRPEFRSKVVDILSSWQEMAPFLCAGDLVNELKLVEGMEYLTRRAAYRDRVYPSSILPRDLPQDHIHVGRDSLADSASLEREEKVFQAVGLTYASFSGISVCKNLYSLMLQWNKVTGVQTWSLENVEIWLGGHRATISDIWCTLYELCRQPETSRFEITVALAFQRFRGVSLELVAAFSAVLHDQQFTSTLYKCPRFSVLELANGPTFKEKSIRGLLAMHEIAFEKSDQYATRPSSTKSESERIQRARELYRSALEAEYQQLMNELRGCWPNPPGRPLKTILRLLEPSAEIIEDNVRPLLNSWAQNYEFHSFIQRVQYQINKIPSSEASCPKYVPPRLPLTARCSRRVEVTLESLMRERSPGSVYSLVMDRLDLPSNPKCNQEDVDALLPLLRRLRAGSSNTLQIDYVNSLEDSLEAYKTHLLQTTNDYLNSFDEGLFESLRLVSLEHNRVYLEQVRRCLRPNTPTTQLMRAAGIWPTVTVHALLQCLSLKMRRALPPSWNGLLIRHAVTIHDVRRINRILQLARTGIKSVLESELQYTRTWDPSKHPDWLLVEIEADISVRPVQAAIAEEMLQPESGQNCVMQLNMGEGKSSVIVPIVAASASIKRNLCRVVVLGPQMKQQFQILRQTMTGLCNRRIIYLPFNRKVHLDKAAISWVHKLLRDGAVDGAIWICEPEHLLSLKLLALDQAVHRGVRDLVDLHLWLHDNSKDILDESDEVLHVKQQVIYTVGIQQPLDGAPARWEIVQKLLGLLATKLVKDPQRQDSSSFIIGTGPNVAAFPTIRIRSDAARQYLERLMTESLDNRDWPLPPHMNRQVAAFITARKPSKSLMSCIQPDCSDKDRRMVQMILILRGLIGGDIFMHSLREKRWRVQYGLDLQRSKLAIPFRAKDSPSPRSEFGHPDITIVLTCLSYYYRGLDLEMVRQVLQSLLSSEAPDIIYADWLRPCWNTVPKALQTIQGLDLGDEIFLQTQIYPLLRHNKAAIDFYLNIFVFPRYAREFPLKMSTSGWDIAITKPNPTTGFSGTNDGRLLLPVTVTQSDQDAQLHTNAKVLSYILKKENSEVICHPGVINSASLLDAIQKLSPVPTVILDVGAQILDLPNIEFAKSWLKIYQDDENIKAVVFFDDSNNLLVLTLDGATQPFIGSPYSTRLEECLVYLDEAHTRGTDLRIPPNTRAVVTLGPKLHKDKLVQGCMRMRKLGEGHSLVFIGSSEVANLIRNATGIKHGNITTEDIVFWSIKETWRQLQADLPAWVLQGHSFVRRENAWKNLSGGKLVSPEAISAKFYEPEARSLDSLYGTRSNEDRHCVWEDHSVNSNEIIQKIVRRCWDFDPFTIMDAGVHEEMEIELAHEKEVEREVERPPDAEAAQHVLHANVERFVDTGDISILGHRGFRSAAAAFSGTSFMVPKGFDAVFPNIIVTEDFWRTIQLPSNPATGSMDSFMRSVEWVVTVETAPTTWMIFFSPYEVNRLLDKFRTSAKVKLHVFAPRMNPAAPSLEDLSFLTLPSTDSSKPQVSRNLAFQLNLFSGALYLRDYETYLDVCRTLRLYFEPLPPHLEESKILNASFFVLHQGAREELGRAGPGFEENALPFFRDMIRMRRFGRGFGPSHMGKILHASRLEKSDFVGEAIQEQ